MLHFAKPLLLLCYQLYVNKALLAKCHSSEHDISASKSVQYSQSRKLVTSQKQKFDLLIFVQYAQSWYQNVQKDISHHCNDTIFQTLQVLKVGQV